MQLNGAFGFADAAAIVSYLDNLGVSHCYCSPFLKSQSGSRHGYDIIDHGALDPEIGTADEFERFCSTLSEHELGQILDIVPNHMAVMGRQNPWWNDVLENGQASEYAEYFDIDWSPLRASLTGKILLPVLGDHYGTVLEGTDLELVFDRRQGSFAAQYHEHQFPLDPREYPRVLLARIDRFRTGNGTCAGALSHLQSLIAAFAQLPERSVRDPDGIAQRRRVKETLKRRLADLIAGHTLIDDYLEGCLEAFNGPRRDAERLERMHQLLEAQAFRLAYWRVASHEINYRRFFDINDLAGLRMESPAVFDATHRLIAELVATGKVDGLRVDHPDGLYDPRGYFDRLQESLGGALRDGRATADDRPLYVVAEKVLGHGERLPGDWPIHGTTGYEFVDLVTRLFVHPKGMSHLTRAYHEFTGNARSFAHTAYHARKLIIETSLASEFNVLVTKLDRIAEADPHTRDFGLGGLRNALAETIASLPVYRTYVNQDEVSDADASVVREAVATAKRRAAAADTSVFDFVCDVLTLRADANADPAHRLKVLDFVMRLQQYTGPVAAKGVEDTAFYRDARLIALNDVGCHPDAGNLSAEAFHRANVERQRRWPLTMLASSTHDSKRSEDVRARITVLSELAPEWMARVTCWSEMNSVLKQPTANGEQWPDAALEYFLYQTLIGAWPLEPSSPPQHRLFIERVRRYMRKAAREAKLHTSWINENVDYEHALDSFVESIMDWNSSAEFLADFERFQARVSTIGLYTSLSQTLLRTTVPGVPDIYQGNELWRFDLVDPDNRRAVDFSRRRDMLAQLRGRPTSVALAEELIDDLGSGAAKLHVMHSALRVRREQPGLFRHGDYVPLRVTGALQVYLCAFARRDADRIVVVLAPRWFADLSNGGARRPLGTDVWRDTQVALPDRRCTYEDLLTGATIGPHDRSDDGGVEVGRVLAHFPVCLLSAARSSQPTA